MAQKEVRDSWRDRRSVIASLLYAIMGPAVVFMVSLATRVDGVLIGMTSVFTLVSAFVGGMNVAMDTIAGERERHSLLPLLLNPVARRDIVTGKFLAVSLFSLAGLVINLLGFALVLHMPRLLPALVAALLPLALLAAGLQLLISTVCRATKEAQTYLSMLVFLPMGFGLSQVFFPAVHEWFTFLPLLGQQLQFEAWLKGAAAPFGQAAALGCFTAALALLAIEAAANRLRRDEIVYGD